MRNILITAARFCIRGHSRFCIRGHSRNHQGGGGFQNDYANVFFALSNADFDYGRGRGLETDKNWLRNMWTAPQSYSSWSFCALPISLVNPMNLTGRIEAYTSNPSIITIKDHKRNFDSSPSCWLKNFLNSRREIGNSAIYRPIGLVFNVNSRTVIPRLVMWNHDFLAFSNFCGITGVSATLASDAKGSGSSRPDQKVGPLSGPFVIISNTCFQSVTKNKKHVCGLEKKSTWHTSELYQFRKWVNLVNHCYTNFYPSTSRSLL